MEAPNLVRAPGLLCPSFWTRPHIAMRCAYAFISTLALLFLFGDMSTTGLWLIAISNAFVVTLCFSKSDITSLVSESLLVIQLVGFPLMYIYLEGTVGMFRRCIVALWLLLCFILLWWPSSRGAFFEPYWGHRQQEEEPGPDEPPGPSGLGIFTATSPSASTQADAQHTTQAGTHHTTQAGTHHTTQAGTHHTIQAGIHHTTQADAQGTDTHVVKKTLATSLSQIDTQIEASTNSGSTSSDGLNPENPPEASPRRSRASSTKRSESQSRHAHCHIDPSQISKTTADHGSQTNGGSQFKKPINTDIMGTRHVLTAKDLEAQGRRVTSFSPRDHGESRNPMRDVMLQYNNLKEMEEASRHRQQRTIQTFGMSQAAVGRNTLIKCLPKEFELHRELERHWQWKLPRPAKPTGQKYTLGAVATKLDGCPRPLRTDLYQNAVPASQPTIFDALTEQPTILADADTGNILPPTVLPPTEAPTIAQQHAACQVVVAEPVIVLTTEDKFRGVCQEADSRFWGFVRNYWAFQLTFPPGNAGTLTAVQEIRCLLEVALTALRDIHTGPLPPQCIELFPWAECIIKLWNFLQPHGYLIMTQGDAEFQGFVSLVHGFCEYLGETPPPLDMQEKQYAPIHPSQVSEDVWAPLSTPKTPSKSLEEHILTLTPLQSLQGPFSKTRSDSAVAFQPSGAFAHPAFGAGNNSEPIVYHQPAPAVSPDAPMVPSVPAAAAEVEMDDISPSDTTTVMASQSAVEAYPAYPPVSKAANVSVSPPTPAFTPQVQAIPPVPISAAQGNDTGGSLSDSVSRMAIQDPQRPPLSVPHPISQDPVASPPVPISNVGASSGGSAGGSEAALKAAQNSILKLGSFGASSSTGLFKLSAAAAPTTVQQDVAATTPQPSPADDLADSLEYMSVNRAQREAAGPSAPAQSSSPPAQVGTGAAPTVVAAITPTASGSQNADRELDNMKKELAGLKTKEPELQFNFPSADKGTQGRPEPAMPQVCTVTPEECGVSLDDLFDMSFEDKLHVPAKYKNLEWDQYEEFTQKMQELGKPLHEAARWAHWQLRYKDQAGYSNRQSYLLSEIIKCLDDVLDMCEVWRNDKTDKLEDADREYVGWNITKIYGLESFANLVSEIEYMLVRPNGFDIPNKIREVYGDAVWAELSGKMGFLRTWFFDDEETARFKESLLFTESEKKKKSDEVFNKQYFKGVDVGDDDKENYNPWASLARANGS